MDARGIPRGPNPLPRIRSQTPVDATGTPLKPIRNQQVGILGFPGVTVGGEEGPAYRALSRLAHIVASRGPVTLCQTLKSAAGMAAAGLK